MSIEVLPGLTTQISSLTIIDQSHVSSNGLRFALSHLNSFPGWVLLMLVVWLVVLVWALVAPWSLASWKRRAAAGHLTSDRKLCLSLAGCLVLWFSAAMVFMMDVLVLGADMLHCYDCGYQKEGILVAIPLALSVGMLVTRIKNPVLKTVLIDLCWSLGVISSVLFYTFMVIAFLL